MLITYFFRRINKPTIATAMITAIPVPIMYISTGDCTIVAVLGAGVELPK